MLFDKQIVTLLQDIMNKEGTLYLPAWGTSMFPFIQKGDICTFIRCEPLLMNKGDVCLFYTSDGRLVAHRFYYQKVIDGVNTFYFKGDTNFGFDERIKSVQIIGKLRMIERKNKKLYVNQPTLYIWGRLIQLLPFFSVFLRHYIK